MRKIVSPAQFDQYFQTAQRSQRIVTLRKWHQDQTFVPAGVSKLMFSMPLSLEERIALLEASTCTENPLALEVWIFSNLLNWKQDVAAAALRCWSDNTDRLLWHRLIPILRIPSLPQRLSYTILDVSPSFAGPQVTEAILESKGWEDFSTAYQALLFDRSIQFDCQSKRLDVLAVKVLQNASTQTHPEDKSLVSAAAWLLKSGQTSKLESIICSAPEAPWKSMMQSAVEDHKDRKKSYDRLAKLLDKTNLTFEKILSELPPFWSRGELPMDTVCQLVESSEQTKLPVSAVLQGVSRDLLRSLCREPSTAAQVRIAVQQWLGEDTKGADREVLSEREKLLSSNSHLGLCQKDFAASKQSSLDESVAKVLGPTRTSFLAGLSSNTSSQTSAGGDEKDFWSLLSAAWSRGSNTQLQPLVVESRKQKGLASVAYLATLGRLAGNDEAVLKIMDHIRTSEEDELRVIVTALGEINTSRSLLELISIITRPNATVTVQQDAVAVLAKKDLSALQKELRATVQDLKVPADPASPIAEIRETLVNLIHTHDVDTDASTSSTPTATGIDDKSLDTALASMIPHYRKLSSEVCRALRTALFFNQTITGSEATHAIDLSPLIDMQYKAMELLFREFFEEAASQALLRGDIPRKLDVIGYARPIPIKMDEFENYIASLDVVRDIPFFSKFKLRKMLRAICQFQPGRRFTLDGLKAFGLFFLCFSRSQCRFGLSNLFPIGAKSDRELAEFAKELHIFQDFRNRAAHEGFHPQASNDIQGIWRSTALIVQWAFRIRDSLAAPVAATFQKQAS